ncbi:MAG: hypothetical protein ACRENG_34555, partial [bacterium]
MTFWNRHEGAKRQIGDLFVQIDRHLQDGNNDAAERLLEEINNIAQRTFRKAHEDKALVYSRMATIAQSLGKQR